VTNDRNRGLRDLSVREWLVIGPVCAVAIGMGVVPNLFLRPMEPAVRRTLGEIVAVSTPVNAQAAPPDASMPVAAETAEARPLEAR
jgi:NADH:ubiquinone oxidoreductase subunit 4 (subunit M)